MTGKTGPGRLGIVFVIGVAVLLASCGPPVPDASAESGTRSDPTSSVSGAGPRLAIVVVADGLPWDRLAAYRDVYRGGLKRLLDEGTVFSGCRYRHVPTETAPGHASIATGTSPSGHGIVANEWLELNPAEGRMRSVYCLDDPSGRTRVAGPVRLMVDTIGDVLASARRGSQVIALSGKDRSSVLLAGRDRRHGVYWYDSGSGTFVTSPYYRNGSPVGTAVRNVVAAFNVSFSAESFRRVNGTLWRRLPPPQSPPRHPPATGLGAFQNPVVGATFDHDLASAKAGFADGLLHSPFIDALTADLALALLDDRDLGLGRRDAPDLMLLSFSGLDYVSHAYGNESEEAFETIRQLDGVLGRLLADLERRFGKGAVVVALTADHGFCPLPRGPDRGGPTNGSGRLDVRELVAAINGYATRDLCLEDGARPALAFRGGGVYYDRARSPWDTSTREGCTAAKPAVGAADLDPVAERAVNDRFGRWVESVVSASSTSVPERAAVLDGFVLRSRFDGRSPDLHVFVRSGVIPDGYGGKGTTHGSHHDYDTHVPLVFWGGRWTARTVADEVAPYDLAPTLAATLGVRLKGATGRALEER